MNRFWRIDFGKSILENRFAETVFVHLACRLGFVAFGVPYQWCVCVCACISGVYVCACIIIGCVCSTLCKFPISSISHILLTILSAVCFFQERLVQGHECLTT